MSRLSALVTYGGDESDEAESDQSPSEATEDEEPVQDAGEAAPETKDVMGDVEMSEGGGEGDEAMYNDRGGHDYGDEAGNFPFKTSGIALPGNPPGGCDAQLQERVRTFMAKKALGQHFNDKLRKNKEFQNPHICEKLVEHLRLDEFGSECPRDVFDPNEFGADMEYDQLATRQRQYAAARAREQARRTQIDFHSPSAPSPPQVAALVNTAAARAAAAGALARLAQGVAAGVGAPKR